MNRVVEIAKAAKLNLKQKDALAQILISVAEVLLASWIIGPLIEARLRIGYTVIGGLSVLMCWLLVIKLLRTKKQ